ncbi:MAG: CDP-diacylglycerol--serine O-phosphatidyltransferase [Acidobacteriota bacterium]|nr:CDP-diacylglycerol--serine O-phosphatidyltransferase [Acidobacteriota bacterium]
MAIPNNESWRYAAPNAVTAANIAAGFGSICAAANGRFEAAVYLLVLAVLLDMADGRVARRFNATSELGQQLDSFSDAISFCAAPAFLVQRALLTELEGIGVAVSITYVLAGVFRLARFNLESDAHGKAAKTCGVPTPIAAGYLMALALMRTQISPQAAALVVLFFAGLMISRIPLPETNARGVLGFAFFIGFWNYMAVVFRPNWYTVGWWNVWNVVILLIARAQERKLRAEVEA